MSTPFLFGLAATLCAIVGLAHSVLGERYILTRLFRRSELPPLLGGTEFTRRTLRFAWHLTSLAWWGFAALFASMAQGPLTTARTCAVLAIVFLINAAVTFGASRGRHLAWPIFLAIGVIAALGARG
jgi:hypothetical protein